MKLAELMDTIVSDVTQHCLRITDEQHHQLNNWHWSVSTVVSGYCGHWSVVIVVSGYWSLVTVVTGQWSLWSLVSGQWLRGHWSVVTRGLIFLWQIILPLGDAV